jgi:hypothetical protein
VSLRAVVTSGISRQRISHLDECAQSLAQQSRPSVPEFRVGQGIHSGRDAPVQRERNPRRSCATDRRPSAANPYGLRFWAYSGA